MFNVCFKCLPTEFISPRSFSIISNMDNQSALKGYANVLFKYEIIFQLAMKCQHFQGRSSSKFLPKGLMEPKIFNFKVEEASKQRSCFVTSIHEKATSLKCEILFSILFNFGHS